MTCPKCGSREILVDVDSEQLNYNPAQPPMICVACGHKAERPEFEVDE